jgi:hypothetical protein
MLKEISIARVATYGEDSQRLDDLREINFLFGTNGSGKTTISRVIANPSSYADCAVNWRDARALEPLVYNCDFVEQNFTPQLCGIFTLGKVEADTLKKIEKARAKVADIEAEIGRLKGTLGAVDNSSGKRAELCNLRNVFEDQCWAIKSTHDPHFEGAFLYQRSFASTDVGPLTHTYGSDHIWHIGEFGPRLAGRGDDGVIAFEHPVGEPV